MHTFNNNFFKMKKLIIKFLYLIKYLPYRLKKKIYDILKQDINNSLVNKNTEDYILNLEFKNTEFKLILPLDGISNLKQHYGELYGMRNGGPTYELMMMEVLTSLNYSKEEINFFDIGSYLGYYTVFMKQYNGKASVYSIESNPKFCSYIKKSLMLNEIHDVNVDNIALSNNNISKIFFKNQLFTKDTLSEKIDNLTYSEINTLDNAREFGKEVTSLTLDEYIENNKIYPNIIKIDVHASEGLLLEGSMKTLKNKNFDFLLLELHPDHALQIFSKAYSRDKILKLLLDFRLNCLIIDGFRASTRSTNRKQFLSDKIIKYKIIEQNNINDLLFGQDVLDMFILVVRDIKMISENSNFSEIK